MELPLVKLREEAAGNEIKSEDQGQPDMRVTELGEVAADIRQSNAWEMLFRGAKEDKIQLVEDFRVLLKALAVVYPGVKVPLFDSNVAEVATKMFSTLPQMDSRRVYEILGAGMIYGAIHRFQVQSMPEGLSVDFGKVVDESGIKPPAYEGLLKFVPWSFARRVNKMLEVGNRAMVAVDEGFLSKETKWRSNDKETRHRLTREMFEHLKKEVSEEQNPDQHFIVLEPGGGNGEGSVPLAEMIADDEKMAGRVTVLVREYELGMIWEGWTKMFLLNLQREKQGKKPIDIEFIRGSAATPVAVQLGEAKALLDQVAEEWKTWHQTETGGAFRVAPLAAGAPSEIRKLHEDFGILYPEQGEALLRKLNGSRISGGMSFFTAGAMSTELGDNSIAVQIAKQLRDDVEVGGLILWNDFADAPDTKFVDGLTDKTRERVEKMVEIFKAYGKLGFKKGLDRIYKFWGGGLDENNPGHDVRQIWQIKEAMEGMDEAGSETEAGVDLKVFSLLPRFKKGNQWVCSAVPGYFELLVRTRGKAEKRPLDLGVVD